MERFLQLVDKPLEEWLENTTDDHFPNTCSYKSRYVNTIRDISDNILKDVRLSALIQDLKNKENKSYEDLLFLNGHGEEHVKQVIKRASDLLIKSKVKLTPYECYLLLISIYIHDSGIIFGRKEHESNC